MKLYILKKEIKHAKAALELMKNLGHSSYESTIKLINNGGLINSNITSSDVRRAEHIYGRSREFLNGQKQDRKAHRYNVEHTDTIVRQVQTLHLDVMTIDSVSFLVGVLKPINLIITIKLKQMM